MRDLFLLATEPEAEHERDYGNPDELPPPPRREPGGSL